MPAISGVDLIRGQGLGEVPGERLHRQVAGVHDAVEPEHDPERSSAGARLGVDTRASLSRARPGDCRRGRYWRRGEFQDRGSRRPHPDRQGRWPNRVPGRPGSGCTGPGSTRRTGSPGAAAAPGPSSIPAQVPGQDGAGVVDAVGIGVDAALVGQRVWIWEAAYRRPTAPPRNSPWCRRVTSSGCRTSASFDLGASLGIPFLTAHRCLTVTEDGPSRLGPGTLQDRVVLVAGGAGAVGNAAIQLARWSDATVISTVSSAAKAQAAVAAGADHVIDYRRQDVVTEIRKLAPTGVNTIVEVSAAANAGIDAAVIARHGSVAMYADDGGGEVTVPVRSRWRRTPGGSSSSSTPRRNRRRRARSTTFPLRCWPGRSGWARRPACRCTISRSRTRRPPTRRSRPSIVGKVLIDVR